MASIVLKDASLTVNSVDLSAFIQQITLNRTKDTPQSTAMGDNSHEYLADGLKNGTFTATFRGDYAAGNVDPTLDTIYDLTATTTFEILPNGGSVGVTNPKFAGACIITDYGPVDGSVGDQATVAASFQVSGDITRTTA